MDTIAARATLTGTVPDIDIDTATDTTDVTVCAPPMGPASAAEGSDMLTTAPPPPHLQLHQGGIVVLCMVVAAAVVTGGFFAAGAVSIGVVTGSVTVLVAAFAGLGRHWLGHGRRDHPTRDGLLSRSQ